MLLDTAADGGLRMGSDAVTVPGVLASVDADPRLATQKQRCWVYRELASWSRGMDRADYPDAGRDGCKEYPLDAFPWE
jgi:hypothetical protein